jgi:hypothetical protein
LDSAWLDPAVGRCKLVRALALYQREHGLQISLGQGELGRAQGPRDLDYPLQVDIGEF